MDKKKIPFYTQAAMLDSYIHSSNPSKDKATVDVILRQIRSRADLHDYFFKSRPHASWAEILWINGFFATAPSPEQEGEYIKFPRWYEQEYLISVASEVPDIVLRHIENLQADGYYLSGAVEALTRIPEDKAAAAVPKIVTWLENNEVAFKIASEVYELIKRLAKNKQVDSAFILYHALITPLPPKNPGKVGEFRIGTEATSKFQSWADQILNEGANLLANIAPEETVSLLEDCLSLAIKFEGKASNIEDYEKSSWWRTAIEDTNQDVHQDYKDQLLVALRNALDIWVEKSSIQIKPKLGRYLGENRAVLRRLGFYLLQKYPAQFKEYVTSELLKFENLDDTEIHHEFFSLLASGFTYLTFEDQEKLLAEIFKGPNSDRLKELASWSKQEYGTDENEYLIQYPKYWKRDRLWMIRDFLNQKHLQEFEHLIDELGTPDHPDFTRWISSGSWATDASPVEENELQKMSPDGLENFVMNWKPDAQRRFLDRVSYEGLAKTVAALLLSEPAKYEKQIMSIGCNRAEYSVALLEEFAKPENQEVSNWHLFISLFEKILGNDLRQKDMKGSISGPWLWVRKRIVNVLDKGLVEGSNIPSELLPKIEEILFMLANDPDPDTEKDQPDEGSFDYGDPATIAINHVRPLAISTIIRYAFYTLPEHEKKEGRPGEGRLEGRIKELLSKKLDKAVEPSWTVHSIYGKYLYTLYWLDKDWLESNVDRIFPEDDGPVNSRYFIAAWDSFVVFNKFNKELFNTLFSKYEKAIENAGKGLVSKTHLKPEESLCVHLLLEYFLTDKEIQAAPERQPLLVKFFNVAQPSDRGTMFWWLWKQFKDHYTDIVKYWPKIRALWEWRVQQASAANNSTDFDKEMAWLAHLPAEIQSVEPITVLWPIIEGLIPHVVRQTHGNGWHALEKYLSNEVERNPEKTIQFYYLMVSYSENMPDRGYRTKEEQKIIESAASADSSRKIALSVIDLLARKGIDKYRDIYERYA
jgi:hypothetical protein